MPAGNQPESRNTIDMGLLGYAVFPLVAVFVGPLEAALGLAAYWLLK